MRLLIPSICLLLCACGSQSREDYDYDRWENYEPGQTYYDRTYVPPQKRTPDTLVEQAHRAELDGRDDKARVDYQQAFLRDRWHVLGNTRYQDLMLRNDLEKLLWQEYLDLWMENQGRGDALWFHLRPMVLERAGQAPATRGTPLTKIQQLRFWGLVSDVEAAADDATALTIVEEALAEKDWIELHRLRISLWPTNDLEALVRRYAEAAEDDPSNGDALALHALSVARSDALAAIRMLRDGYVLGLPGYWLYRSYAEICADIGDGLDGDTREDRRQAAGWYRCAEAMYVYISESEAGNVSDELQGVQEALARLSAKDLDATP